MAEAGAAIDLTDPASCELVDAPAKADPYPPAFQAWVGTLLLTLLFALAYLDRQIISLMVSPIRAEFGIGDLQVGLLQGFAFAVLYALCGLPLGMAVDRFPRRFIILGGVLVWSLAAMGSGLANSYEQLLVSRILVGAGEAALAPASYAILSDLFPKQKLTFALGVFMLGAALGAEGSLVLGGYVLHAAEGGVALPLLGVLEPWRFAFIITGFPGLFFAFAALAIREPGRRHRTTNADTGGGWSEVFHFMLSRRRFFTAHLLGFSMTMALVYARLAWTPTFLIRRFDWTAPQAGHALGIFGLITGPVALLGGGRLVDVLYARGTTDAHFRYYVAGGIVLGIFGVLSYLSPSPTLFFAAMLVAVIPINMGAIGASAAQVVTPPHLRGRVSAIYLMFVALIGMTAGPAFVGFLTQNILHDEQSIGVALAITFGMLGPLIALLFASGLKAMREAVALNDAPSENTHQY